MADDTEVIKMEPVYQPGDYVHVLGKIMEIDPNTNAYTLQFYDPENDYPVVVRQELITGLAPVPVPSEPEGDDVMVLDSTGRVWHPANRNGERRWYTTNDVGIGDSWANVFRAYGPLHIYELRAVTDNPNGGNA